MIAGDAWRIAIAPGISPASLDRSVYLVIEFCHDPLGVERPGP
jgi:hypothetical protein